MNQSDEIRETFFQECEELLEALMDGLQAMNDETGDDETINSIFRAVHSIKGGAGAFGFDHLVAFSHEFESTLDAIRNDSLELNSDILEIFQRSYDMLGDLVAAAYSNTEIESSLSSQLIKELNKLLEGVVDSDQGSDASFEFAAVSLPFEAEPLLGSNTPQLGSLNDFTIRFSPHSLLYQNGNETTLIFRALADLGSVETICDTSAIPDFDVLDPEEAYLSWVVYLSTSDGEAAVQEVFDFVEGTCDLQITPGRDQGGDTQERPSLDDNDTVLLGTEDGTEDADFSSDSKPAKQVVPTSSTKGSKAPVASVRVDVTRVDRLINLVGELVMNQAMLSQCISDDGNISVTGFTAGLDDLKQLSREIQDSVMSIRTQPVKPLFQRMFRIVRESAAATGKSVRLDIIGEMTEVDKTVIEKLADPLTHMIRNAIDHGVESPDKRKANGKSDEGVIKLSAAHRSGRIVIEIVDDGGGINRERVRQNALDKGIISDSDELTPEETDELLFKPGFSTAKEVSNLSGRGVGLDVVKNAVRMLNGRISISSKPGQGTTFSINLPLTLAVLDGMIVEIAGQRAVIPISAIIETVLPDENEVHQIGTSNVVSMRGSLLPIIYVSQALGYRDDKTPIKESILMLVENNDGVRYALCVDKIIDQRQVVIKGLDDNYGHVAGVSAATILGDGGIALILDLDDPLFSSGHSIETTETTLARTG